MAHVEGSITIHASPKMIQQALEAVEEAPQWAEHLQSIWDVKGRGAGCSYQWKYSQKGITFSGQTKVLESTPGRFVMTTIGGIPSTWTWTMLPFGDETELRLAIEYTVPGSVFGKIADKLIVERENQKAITNGLAALKKRLESRSK